MDNAIAYGCTKEKPVIRLYAALQAKNLVVDVIDHGTGIADSQKTPIFDRFYRADKSRNTKEHSGLGLSIAKMLAGHMSLSLEIIDTPGGGATFRLKNFKF